MVLLQVVGTCEMVGLGEFRLDVEAVQSHGTGIAAAQPQPFSHTGLSSHAPKSR